MKSYTREIKIGDKTFCFKEFYVDNPYCDFNEIYTNKEQLKILLHEAMLLNKLRNLTMEYSLMGKYQRKNLRTIFTKQKKN